MTTLDISWLAYYMPIFGFLFVFTVIYAVLIKTKVLGEGNPFVNLLISFIFGIIFISFAPGVNYVQTIIPWFAILIISLFFLLMIAGFAGKTEDIVKPSVAWGFIGILIIMFLWSAIIVFNPFIQPYIDKFLYSERVYGAILLFVVAAAASWVITRKGK
ncbi:MAG: hypothetical protein QW727_03655 [Candidatus Pacearchaeota archaeon]